MPYLFENVVALKTSRHVEETWQKILKQQAQGMILVKFKFWKVQSCSYASGMYISFNFEESPPRLEIVDNSIDLGWIPSYRGLYWTWWFNYSYRRWTGAPVDIQEKQAVLPLRLSLLFFTGEKIRRWRMQGIRWIWCRVIRCKCSFYSVGFVFIKMERSTTRVPS